MQCADSGNQAGDLGARALSKVLQVNRKLSVLHWDRNGTSPQGFSDVAAAMQRYFLQYILLCVISMLVVLQIMLSSFLRRVLVVSVCALWLSCQKIKV